MIDLLAKSIFLCIIAFYNHTIRMCMTDKLLAIETYEYQPDYQRLAIKRTELNPSG